MNREWEVSSLNGLLNWNDQWVILTELVKVKNFLKKDSEGAKKLDHSST